MAKQIMADDDDVSEVTFNSRRVCPLMVRIMRGAQIEELIEELGIDTSDYEKTTQEVAELSVAYLAVGVLAASAIGADIEDFSVAADLMADIFTQSTERIVAH